MIEGFIVVRKEKHLNNKYWICVNKIDAFKIASDVAQYWRGKYDHHSHNIETAFFSTDMLFNCSEVSQGLFSVQILNQKINEAGETQVP